MTQASQDNVGMNKPNFPVELRDAVIEYIDDRSAYRQHIRELTIEVEELECDNELLNNRLEVVNDRLERALVELRTAWNEENNAYVEELEESLRIARKVKDAACWANDALHKKNRELSRQLAGARAAKTKLKKRLT